MRRSNHSTLRRLVGTSVVVLATVVPAGVAAAADYPVAPGPRRVPELGLDGEGEHGDEPEHAAVHRWRRGRARVDRCRRRARGHGAGAPLAPPASASSSPRPFTATTSTVGRAGVSSG